MSNQIYTSKGKQNYSAAVTISAEIWFPNFMYHIFMISNKYSIKKKVSTFTTGFMEPDYKSFCCN